MQLQLITFRVCNTCEVEKSSTAFSKDSRVSHGLQVKCRECCSAYRAANKERIAASKKAWAEENAEWVKAEKRRRYLGNREAILEECSRYREENAESRRAQQREYQRKNTARLNAKCREWYRKNKDRARQRNRAWRETNPDPIGLRQRKAKYRALQANAPGSHTRKELRQMLRDQKGLCAYCEVSIIDLWSLDHMIPLSRGGSNGWENLALTCMFCNCAKGAKTAEEYWVYLRRR